MNWFSFFKKPKSVSNRNLLLQEVKDVLTLWGIPNLILLDKSYRACNEEEFRAATRSSWSTRLHTYKPDVMDCDDFALDFKVYMKQEYGVTAVGIVIDKGHAYNVGLVITESGQIKVVPFEPQLGKSAPDLVSTSSWGII